MFANEQKKPDEFLFDQRVFTLFCPSFFLSLSNNHLFKSFLGYDDRRREYDHNPYNNQDTHGRFV